uniref:hypothetical protein n=1 Tax=uncultured Altererythrobacter sp. TaxID=500840 RepID=UPI002628CD40|nr:hypothetical protein [uncultured Altererythrobacter sp.]
MSDSLAHFLISFVSALISAYLTRFVLRRAVSEEAASVGGMAVVVGLAVGSAPVFEGLPIVERTGVLLGFVAGLGALWFQFFKRVRTNG